MAAVRRGACQWSRKEGGMLMWRLEGREGSEAKLAAGLMAEALRWHRPRPGTRPTHHPPLLWGSTIWHALTMTQASPASAQP